MPHTVTSSKKGGGGDAEMINKGLINKEKISPDYQGRGAQCADKDRAINPRRALEYAYAKMTRRRIGMMGTASAPRDKWVNARARQNGWVRRPLVSRDSLDAYDANLLFLLAFSRSFEDQRMFCSCFFGRFLTCLKDVAPNRNNFALRSSVRNIISIAWVLRTPWTSNYYFRISFCDDEDVLEQMLEIRMKYNYMCTMVTAFLISD